jgi:hypothetical protein
MDGRASASKQQSVGIIIAGLNASAASISWNRRPADRCGLPAIHRRAQVERLTC